MSLFLFDPQPSQNRYLKPYVRSSFVADGFSVMVNNIFCTIQCFCIPSATYPWINQTCTMCTKIPLKSDFCGRVMCENHSVEKRGCMFSEGGRRLGYLFLDELGAHSRVIRKKLQLESFYHWAPRARILQLKVKRHT